MIINGQWVDENNQANWSYGPNGGQGLFNPNQQKVYWNNGTPSYQAPKQNIGPNGQPMDPTFGATAPGWLTGGSPTTNPGTTLPGGTNSYTPPNTTYTRDLTPGLVLGGVPTGSQNNGAQNPVNTGSLSGGTPQNAGSSFPSFPSGLTNTTLPGATPYNYSQTAGGIPQVPNPVSTAGQAIAGNQGNLGGISTLSQGVGSINAGLGALPYIQNLPNYQSLLGQASGNALNNLQGRLNPDVINQINQAAAERGVSTGSPGGPNANSAFLRALGLNSLQLQNQGQQQFGQLVGLTPTGPSFNPSSMFIDPNTQQMAQTAANLYNAAPIPQYAQNAALAALQRGLGQGQRATGPSGTNVPNQAQQAVNDIIGRYASTANPYGQANRPTSTPYPTSYPDMTSYGAPINPETGESAWDYGYQGGQTDNPEWDYYSGDYGTNSGDLGYNPEWDYGGEGSNAVDSYYSDYNPEWGD